MKSLLSGLLRVATSLRLDKAAAWASWRLAGQARLWAWISLASEILIVVTGGVVRLTGSGLGCTDWPECTAGNLSTTPAQGIHGAIEFGNRMLTGVLIIIAVATLLAVRGAAFKSATKTSWMLIAGIFVQAVVGGVTVWIKLIPWLVGVHFVLSAIMIVLSSLLVWRVYYPKRAARSGLIAAGAYPLVFLGGLVVFIGVLTTGAGPHAGDAQSVRNGLAFDVVEKFHSAPAYALVLVELVLVAVLLLAKQVLAWRVVGGLLVATLAQAALGIYQTYIVTPSLPALLVGFHMFGASVLISLLAFSWLVLRSQTNGKVEN